VIDTSAMLAALMTQHEHHGLARPHLPKEGPVPAIVLAEVYALLRRTFALTADAALQAIGYWALNTKRIAALPAGAYSETFARARALDLGGNVHDALIAKTCAHHHLTLATLDRRQHAVAVAFGVDSTYLLA